VSKEEVHEHTTQPTSADKEQDKVVEAAKKEVARVVHKKVQKEAIQAAKEAHEVAVANSTHDHRTKDNLPGIPGMHSTYQSAAPHKKADNVTQPLAKDADEAHHELVHGRDERVKAGMEIRDAIMRLKKYGSSPTYSSSHSSLESYLSSLGYHHGAPYHSAAAPQESTYTSSSYASSASPVALPPLPSNGTNGTNASHPEKQLPPILKDGLHCSAAEAMCELYGWKARNACTSATEAPQISFQTAECKAALSKAAQECQAEYENCGSTHPSGMANNVLDGVIHKPLPHTPKPSAEVPPLPTEQADPRYDPDAAIEGLHALEPVAVSGSVAEGGMPHLDDSKEIVMRPPPPPPPPSKEEVEGHWRHAVAETVKETEEERAKAKAAAAKAKAAAVATHAYASSPTYASSKAAVDVIAAAEPVTPHEDAKVSPPPSPPPSPAAHEDASPQSGESKVSKLLQHMRQHLHSVEERSMTRAQLMEAMLKKQQQEQQEASQSKEVPEFDYEKASKEYKEQASQFSSDRAVVAQAFDEYFPQKQNAKQVEPLDDDHRAARRIASEDPPEQEMVQLMSMPDSIIANLKTNNEKAQIQKESEAHAVDTLRKEAAQSEQKQTENEMGRMLEGKPPTEEEAMQAREAGDTLVELHLSGLIDNLDEPGKGEEAQPEEEDLEVDEDAERRSAKKVLAIFGKDIDDNHVFDNAFD